MSFQQISSLRKNRVYAPMLLALAIILAVFVARPAFTEYNDANMTLVGLKSSVEEKQWILNELLAMEESISQENGMAQTAQINAINRPFHVADILEAVMINEFTHSSIAGGARVFVSSVSTNPGVKLPSGISRGSVSMTLAARNIDEIINYLTHLVTDSGIAFILDDVNLPIDTAEDSNETLSLVVTLGVYYFE